MIRLAEVSHEYRALWRPGRSVRALDAVSLAIAPGEAVGIIGLNGAGKTTLLRLLLGYLRPTTGIVSIADVAPRRYVESHGIGYVPERVAIPGHWTVEGALQAYALLGNAGEDGSERVDAALGRLGLGALRERRVAALSKGNLQRLAIAQALLHDRELLVLDEPTDALDPVWIAELRSILERWRAEDPRRTLLIASHNLPQVERVARRVIVLHEGRVRADLALGEGEAAEPLEDIFLRMVRREAEAA
jgi:ABC-type multidrug transport system ATPase subunit